MREIEFRAWHQEAKEMFYPETQSSVFRWKEDGQPIIIEQYTGLNDKNGVKIFEGDILRCWRYGDEYVIEECKYDLRYGFNPMHVPYDYDQDHPIYESNQLEVIGNIHQNPELLEK